MENELVYRLGEHHKFKFENLLSTFYKVAALQTLPAEKISVKTNQMIIVYKNEMRRWEKMKEPLKQQN